MDRRRFIQNSAYLAVGTTFVPQLLASCGTDTIKRFRGKRLVLLHLQGGNDGLNTFVPWRNDIYYASRPNLAIAKHELIELTDELATPVWAQDLADLYFDGCMALYHNVGSPQPNTSHFKSTDIWHAAFTPNERANPRTGWIGRYLDMASRKSEVPPSTLAVDASETFSLLLKGENIQGCTIGGLRDFSHFAPYLEELYSTCHEHPVASYLQKVRSEAIVAMRTLHQYFSPNAFDYPPSVLGASLAQVASLIKNGAPTLFFFITQGGYDTHLAQPGRQKRLLSELGAGLKAFVRDLRAAGLFKDTLVLIYSEFGRRVKENVNMGTDHGVGNTICILSDGLKRAGSCNELPDLNTLAHRNDVAVHMDFRRVYATVLEKWLGVPAPSVLPGHFEVLDFV